MREYIIGVIKPHERCNWSENFFIKNWRIEPNLGEHGW